MKTVIGTLVFVAFWGFAHHDAQKSDNLAAKAASALVTTK